MPPALPAELVNEFVRVAHADLERVQVMLSAEPRLLKATWDWGCGDFDTELGAAAHMGRRDIAEFLIAQGAPLDLFAAAMLDRVEVVEAILAAFPQMKNALGAHGIPLSRHATAGKAEKVLALLQRG